MKSANLNKGHRERLRQKYFDNGIETFAEHEILELMLFSVIPLGNTNHTAHRLISACGGIERVLDADVQTLTRIDGVGQSSAEFIRFQREMFDIYVRSRSRSETLNIEPHKGIEFIKGLFAQNPRVPQLYVLLLGCGNRIISAEKLAEGEISYDAAQIRNIVSYSIRLNAFRIILAHNHVHGNVMPSDGDIMFTKRISRVLALADIEMNDHIVITGETAVSMRNDMHVLNP